MRLLFFLLKISCLSDHKTIESKQEIHQNVEWMETFLLPLFCIWMDNQWKQNCHRNGKKCTNFNASACVELVPEAKSDELSNINAEDWRVEINLSAFHVNEKRKVFTKDFSRDENAWTARVEKKLSLQMSDFNSLCFQSLNAHLYDLV